MKTLYAKFPLKEMDALKRRIAELEMINKFDLPALKVYRAAMRWYNWYRSKAEAPPGDPLLRPIFDACERALRAKKGK